DQVTMSTRFEQLASDAMKLPVRDRVRLAQQLVASLDEDTEAATEKEIEELWFAEAERRLGELRSGSVEGVSAEDAFRNARNALKR
ncbi:MAG TPA: addiction module protein, partial [Pyrinomonadaceae bacterium]|nr:addiction module protein [Pyrinomonadaceae bacterium]